MLFHDDVVAHREPKPGPFARRLGGEERVEHLFPDLVRDAGAVVANADLDMVAAVPGGGAEDGFKSRAIVGLALGHGIEAI